MADQIVAPKGQSLAEIRQWDFDFRYDLPEGVTVKSATATHVPPSGEASTPVVGETVGGSLVPVTLGPLAVTGIHFLDVKATYTNDDVSEIRMHIPVEF
jgi:hypothetical protein